ncbi:phage holin family protein [Planococcus halocryophilus]|uniref:phage holin family protein n=1 Tax=Planococcus halocryophilus TaxID=1215089 RepID=UPI001F102E11|nr:phage holin family protein [Planococcus halocryophilus]MCH4825180.1 phage holin family protein [Planococcus halocryophilus]
MFKKIIIRIQNPKVFIGTVSGILLILVNFDVISIDLSNQITDLVNAILSIGISVGIFANPESHMTNGKEDNSRT